MKWLLYGLAVMVFVAMGLVVILAAPGGPPPLEIGPETTVLEGPLRPDGTIDYLAVMNERLSEGVTPATNAYAKIAPLAPASSWPEPGLRVKVLEQIGAPSGESAVTFETIEAYAERRSSEDERWAAEVEEEDASESSWADLVWEQQWWDARSGEWSDEMPLVAEWLALQEPALDQFAEAVKQEHFWVPRFTGADSDELSNASWLSIHTTLPMYKALSMRAVKHAAEGRAEQAIDDAIAVKQHLAHLRASGWYDFQMGLGSTLHLTEAMLRHNVLTAEQVRDFRRRAAAIPPPRMDQALDPDFRFMLLDALQPGRWVDQALEEDDLDEALATLGRSVFDRNRAMRRVNGFIDRMVDAVSKPTAADRQTAWEALEAETRDMEDNADQFTERVENWWTRLFVREAEVTDAVADWLLLERWYLANSTRNSLLRAQVNERLEKTALAVARYHAERGSYPVTLEDLVPQWLDEVPVDLFEPTGRPLQYRLQADRVVIFSVGQHGYNEDMIDAGEDVSSSGVIAWPRR
ncbi:MAG: hypothetical protein WD294_08835 [Phycisphaeraceae bacterium]